MKKYRYPITSRLIRDFLFIPRMCLALFFIGIMAWIFITGKNSELIGMLIGFVFCIFIFNISYWQITAYPNINLSEEGIYYKRLFSWRFIPWNKIQTITYYDTTGWRGPIPNKGTITSLTTGFFKRNLHITNSMIDYTDAMNYILEHAKNARIIKP